MEDIDEMERSVHERWGGLFCGGGIIVLIKDKVKFLMIFLADISLFQDY
jgi:hypothetical protein